MTMMGCVLIPSSLLSTLPLSHCVEVTELSGLISTPLVSHSCCSPSPCQDLCVILVQIQRAHIISMSKGMAWD